MNQPMQLAGRRRASTLDAMSQGLTQPAPPRISIKAQKFTLVDAAGVQIPVQLFDPQYGLYLDVVIIGVNPNKSKIYYEYDYDPNKDEPPTCFSDNGLAPSAQASVPQSPTCAACPNNAWGSDTSKMTGKPTKACSDRKKLAVIVANDPSQLVYQLQIPPASLKNLSVLANALKSHQVTDSEGPRSADPADVVTRVYFNPQKQGELLFQPMGFHQQLYPYIDNLIAHADKSGIIEIATGSNDVPYSGAIALPNPAAMPALPAPAMQTQAPPPPPPMQPVTQQQWSQPGQAPQPQFQPAPFLQPQPAQQPVPPTPAPRTRRGGARAGAGRPITPQGAPPVAPFQAQAPQPPMQQQAPQQAPQPVPFTPQPAQPFTGTVPPPNQMPDMPAFLDRSANPQPFAGPAPVPQPGGAPAFGMTNGAAPDPALTQALQQAFGAPMQPRARG